jgi:hypothetical protein
VDTHHRQTPPTGLGPIPRLQVQLLQLFHCRLIRHGDFIAVTGANVGKIPPCLWDTIGRHEHRLRVLLRDSPPPGRGRG